MGIGNVMKFNPGFCGEKSMNVKFEPIAPIDTGAGPLLEEEYVTPGILSTLVELLY